MTRAVLPLERRPDGRKPVRPSFARLVTHAADASRVRSCPLLPAAAPSGRALGQDDLPRGRLQPGRRNAR